MMLASDDAPARAKAEDSSEEEAEGMPEIPITDAAEPGASDGSRDEKRREKSKKKLEKLNAASEKRGMSRRGIHVLISPVLPPPPRASSLPRIAENVFAVPSVV